MVNGIILMELSINSETCLAKIDNIKQRENIIIMFHVKHYNDLEKSKKTGKTFEKTN